MGKAQSSKANAILIGWVPLLIFIVDGLFKQSLYSNSPTSFWLFDLTKFVIVPGGILAWLALKHGIGPSQYGATKPTENESWLYFLGLVVFLTCVLSLVYYVSFVASWLVLHLPAIEPFYRSIAPENVLLRIPVVVYFSVTAAGAEEIFFRALPLAYLSERFPNNFPAATYVGTTSFLFGISHWENGSLEVVATTVFGVFAALFYLKLRNIWPLIAAHAATDVWGLW